jgi:hypothetical protein
MAAPRECPTVVTDVAPYVEMAFWTAARTDGAEREWVERKPLWPWMPEGSPGKSVESKFVNAKLPSVMIGIIADGLVPWCETMTVFSVGS